MKREPKVFKMKRTKTTRFGELITIIDSVEPGGFWHQKIIIKTRKGT